MCDELLFAVLVSAPVSGLICQQIPGVVGTSSTISLFVVVVVTKHSEPVLATSMMSCLSVPIEMPQLAGMRWQH